jgi:hypothetical protein
VLLADSTWPTVKRLTGLPRGVLDGRLDELREVRNVVNHNRATTETTVSIVNGLAASLRAGIARFKDEFLYSSDYQLNLPDSDSSEGFVPMLYQELVETNDRFSFQSMLSESQLFYSLTRLPVAPFDCYLNINAFLADMKAREDAILALLVNKQGDEFSLTWPKAVLDVEHDQILRFFFESRGARWSKLEYGKQLASAVCDPRVWFYENARPERV